MVPSALPEATSRPRSRPGRRKGRGKITKCPEHEIGKRKGDESGIDVTIDMDVGGDANVVVSNRVSVGVDVRRSLEICVAVGGIGSDSAGNVNTKIGGCIQHNE
jgi:hypothetical protein